MRGVGPRLCEDGSFLGYLRFAGLHKYMLSCWVRR